MQIKKLSSDTADAIARRPGRLIVLEGMPGAGKTTVADTFRADGARVLGEYTTRAGNTVPVEDHPDVDDDTAHQHNWLRKAALAADALRDGTPVFVDRDWLSALAYAYSIADTDNGRLLDRRARWAVENLRHETLLSPDVYVIFQVGTAESLHRRDGRLRHPHPWSRPGPLQRLQRFYASPHRFLADIHPELVAAVSGTTWEYMSGRDKLEHNLRALRALVDRP